MEDDKKPLKVSNIYNYFGGANIGNIYINTEHFGNEKEKKEEDKELNPYEALLMEMIEPIKESGRWKEIIMPYHAAVVEKVLPKWSHKTFQEKTGLNVPSTSYGVWMKKGCYTSEELEPYTEQFAQLKRQIENSK